MRWREVFASLDWLLLGAALLLVLLGLAMLFSSTQTADLLSSRFSRQLIACGAAVVVCLFVARIPYHVLARYVWFLYGLGLAGLGAVYFAAQVIRGAASRLEFFGFQLQPSEFMKVALIVALAWLFARGRQLRWLTVGGSLLLVSIPVGLILLEPDTGVAMLLLALWGGYLLFLGLPWLAVGGMALLSLVGMAAAWQWWFASYQKARLLVFLDPTRDPLGAGYNVVQSIVALGSGQLFGRGLGHGPQSQLKFLPERHTDFILSSVGEELGFVGVALVLVLYGVLLWRLLVIAQQTRDVFGQLIAVGAFFVLLISLVVSAGMNMGLLPVTGIPLPLVSYGGSSLVSTFLLLGLVQSVWLYGKWMQAPPTEVTHLT